MKWCEIFRAGIHKDSKGRENNYTTVDLDNIKYNFDNQNPDVPICVGHPKSNAPAYGWVDKMKVEGTKLYASYKNVQPEFKEAVQKGLFKTRSISLTKDLILRHIAFLGAKAPAIKGMEQFCFEESKEDDIIINFSEPESQNGDEIKSDLSEPEGGAGAFSSTKKENLNQKPVKMDEKIKEMEEAMSQKDEKILSLENELKKAKDEKLTKEFEDFCENAIKEGHILPSQKGNVIDILQAVNDTNFNFEDEEKNPVSCFKDFISSIKQIEFKQVATPDKIDEPKNFESAEDYKDALIEIQTESQKKGVKLTIEQAYQKLKGDK